MLNGRVENVVKTHSSYVLQKYNILLRQGGFYNLFLQNLLALCYMGFQWGRPIEVSTSSWGMRERGLS